MDKGGMGWNVSVGAFQLQNCLGCRENAMDIVAQKLPTLNLQEKREAVVHASTYLLSKGVVFSPATL